MVAVIYTTPFLSNHLMIQGYADIWLAMFILLIMLSLMDYVDDKQLGLGLTVICYLVMLPMLKLEGWVWLLLFVMAYLLTFVGQTPTQNQNLFDSGSRGVGVGLTGRHPFEFFLW